MRIFISAGEPSGDLHGANLIQCLRARVPSAEFVGFGGDRMQAAGCRLIYPLCQLSIMWFRRVFQNIVTFVRLLLQADRSFRDQRPDAVVLIDYPGFHWWLARRAHARGIPVFYFVPPQLWAWAGWRVRKIRKWVDHVLCTLPFEEEWYRQRGVAAHYIGHPYFDELHRQKLDLAFMDEQRSRSGRVVAILPGSRRQELQKNVPTLLRAAALIHARHPGVRFLVAALDEAQKDTLAECLAGAALPIEVHCGRAAEIIRLATACMAVSGSVGLELLHALVPAVILYRVEPRDMWAIRRFMTSRWISLVNLLAGEEIYPEYLSPKCEADAIAKHISHWLSDAGAREQLQCRLRALREQVAQPGACDRAADFILGRLGETIRAREAA